jgi:hypothetical protein
MAMNHQRRAQKSDPNISTGKKDCRFLAIMKTPFLSGYYNII